MSEPITASEAAVFLRLDGATDSPTPELTFLNSLILASREAVENFLNRTVTERARTLILDDFLTQKTGIISEIILVPFGDVSSVDTISYVDTDGANQTVTEFILSKDRLTPTFGETWPDTRAQLGAVNINYNAGYADINTPAENGTPKPIVQAMFLIIGDMYDNREGVSQSGEYRINPSVQNLLQPYRIDMGV